MKTGIELISEERARQIEQFGWDAEHDAAHNMGELASAAACYALNEKQRKQVEFGVLDIPSFWPFSRYWWKPSPQDRKRELVKAGALIAAELDRIINEENKCKK